MPGDTFVSQGIKYILNHGPKGNLRPYTVGPVVALARKAAPWLPKLGWAGLAIGSVALVGVAIWYACKDDE
jgi:hypothetical protein